MRLLVINSEKLSLQEWLKFVKFIRLAKQSELIKRFIKLVKFKLVKFKLAKYKLVKLKLAKLKLAKLQLAKLKLVKLSQQFIKLKLELFVFKFIIIKQLVLVFIK